jgi:hypothetical protein
MQETNIQMVVTPPSCVSDPLCIAPRLNSQKLQPMICLWSGLGGTSQGFGTICWRGMKLLKKGRVHGLQV